MPDTTLQETGSPITFGHVNLHYRRKEDGPAAARLMEILGLTLTQTLPLPNGSEFYRFTVNRGDPNRGDGIVFLSLLPEPLAALMDVIRQKLDVGGVDEHPTVAAAREGQARDPEQNLHVGFLIPSLEAVEERMAQLAQLAETDPALKGRLKFLVNRAPPGDQDIDRRLDDSPLYRGVTRYTFGRNGVQAFVETDLLVGGPLGDGFVFELDYVFPGHEFHILSVVELGAARD